MSMQGNEQPDLESGSSGGDGPNCYAWGIRHPTRVDPGELSGRKYGTNSNINLRDAAIRDGLLYVGATLPPGKEGHYIVALVASNDDTTAYHWIRQDSAHERTHKAGQMAAGKNDADGTPITNARPPHLASFNYAAFFNDKPLPMKLMAKAQGWAINYDRFVGYFYCPNEGLAVQSRGWCVIL